MKTCSPYDSISNIKICTALSGTIMNTTIFHFLIWLAHIKNAVVLLLYDDKSYTRVLLKKDIPI